MIILVIRKIDSVPAYRVLVFFGFLLSVGFFYFIACIVIGICFYAIVCCVIFSADAGLFLCKLP